MAKWVITDVLGFALLASLIVEEYQEKIQMQEEKIQMQKDVQEEIQSGQRCNITADGSFEPCGLGG